MKAIKLKSKKELFFPPFHKGIVEMEVISINIDMVSNNYILTLKDSCYIEEFEDIDTPIYPDDFDFSNTTPENLSKITYTTKQIKVKKVLGNPNIRQSKQSATDVKNLVKVLQKINPNIKKLDLDDAIYQAFGQGLLQTTKKEIEQEGLKWYQCDTIEDWELIIE